MDLKKAERIAKIIAITGLTASTLCFAASCGNLLNIVTNLPPTTVSSIRNNNSIDLSSYYAEVDQQAKDLYEQLRSGEISTIQFSKKYTYITSDEHLDEWARQSTDPQIKAIIQNYDKKCYELNEAGDKQSKLFLGAMGGIGISTIALTGFQEYFDRKKKLNNTNKNFQELPNPNGKKPTAMDIDEYNSTFTPLPDPNGTLHIDDCILNEDEVDELI
ncbi:MAG: hypothetical protein ACI4PF_01310 [Christensenellales bacterium]